MPDQQIEAASTQVLSTHFKLAFDPMQPRSEDGTDVLKLIFEEPAARALWLFIRRDHIVSQFFTQDVWKAFRRWQKMQPQTAHELQICLSGFEDPALSHPWGGDTTVTIGPLTIRSIPSREIRNAKLAFLLDAMYGRIPLTITIELK